MTNVIVWSTECGGCVAALASAWVENLLAWVAWIFAGTFFGLLFGLVVAMVCRESTLPAFFKTTPVLPANEGDGEEWEDGEAPGVAHGAAVPVWNDGWPADDP